MRLKVVDKDRDFCSVVILSLQRIGKSVTVMVMVIVTANDWKILIVMVMLIVTASNWKRL